jgi:aspartyl-tRNA(Asn)/glutamyl-tRNA(Gln) amidotransferase subunit B
MLYGRGKEVRPDTRGWDDAKGETFHMRYKEKADEYRYFPEPDLPDVYISYKMLSEAKEGVVLSPFEEKQKLMVEYRLDYHTASIIAGREGGTEFYEKACAEGADPVEAVKWMTGDFFAYLNEENLGIGDTKVDGANFAEFLGLIAEGVISGPIAKELLREISKSGERAKSIVERRGLRQVSDDDELIILVKEAVAGNPSAVAAFRAGKMQAAQAIVGQVMKASGGKANPKRVSELVKEFLSE